MKMYQAGVAPNSFINLETVTRLLDATKIKSYRSARVILEFAKAALARAINLSPVYTEELKAVVKPLNEHAKAIGADTSASEYPKWDDLRHWALQTFVEYNKILESRDIDSGEYWQIVADKLNEVESNARSVYTQVKEKAEQGMSILQIVFVTGGLIAVGAVIKNWFEGASTTPNVNVGLLPVPHVSMTTPVHNPLE